MSNADIAVVGLAVMGQNLILNMNDNGYTVVAYNRTTSKVDEFMETRAKGTNIVGAHSIEEMVSKLAKPRKVMMMVKAGSVVDAFIEQILPHLDKGDIVIDGGNSNFDDTQRRCKDLEDKGILYIGAGISGGEEGARNGPSIMPGGNPAAWPHVEPIFKSIAAKTPDGSPCCEWVGSDGAGHFVKMVHNGIEYGDMQLICEAYQLMKSVLGLNNEQLAQVFTDWDKTDMSSYLVSITAEIFKYKDADGNAVIDTILDTAGQKGTGKWTGIHALNYGIPLTLIGESVFARCLSAKKDERVHAAGVFKQEPSEISTDQEAMLKDLLDALLFSKIISYAQGYMLLKEASIENNWDLNFGDIALMWREGCIIKSVFLDNIKQAYDKNPELVNLILDDYFKDILEKSVGGLRRVCVSAIQSSIPVPCISAALNFFDGYKTARLPANLLQAQRDYFGAHTYEKLDGKRGEFFHTDWIGSGGNVSSSTYDV